ncbi:LysR family transcriptional regulator [Sulfitobacter sp. S190]|nr:LysR family transcriptional regulator [Sulfitobacter sp. S190]
MTRHKSLSAAASATGASQPTLSRHLSQLEERVGHRLFYRDTSGLEPTPEGLNLQVYAERMLEAAAGISVEDTSDGPVAGTVRITASRVAASYLLPPMLQALRLRHPRLSVELVASDETHNLLRREADLAIRMYRPTQSDLIARKVAELPLGVFAARSYIARRGLPEHIGDLHRHDVIGYDRSTLIIDGMARMGMKVERSFFAFRSDDQVACWNMIRAGCGIGFGQVAIGRDDPDLVQIQPTLDIGSLPVWLAAHAELRSSPRVRRSFDALAEAFKAF